MDDWARVGPVLRTDVPDKSVGSPTTYGAGRERKKTVGTTSDRPDETKKTCCVVRGTSAIVDSKADGWERYPTKDDGSAITGVEIGQLRPKSPLFNLPLRGRALRRREREGPWDWLMLRLSPARLRRPDEVEPGACERSSADIGSGRCTKTPAGAEGEANDEYPQYSDVFQFDSCGRGRVRSDLPR